MNSTVITVVGNLTADPEMRFLESGRALATFSVAANSRRKNAAGEWEDGEATFVRCTVWGELAENVAGSLTKGTRVIALGELRQRNWETQPTDGSAPEKRSVLELQVDAVGPELRFATTAVTRTQGSARPSGPPPEAYENEEAF